MGDGNDIVYMYNGHDIICLGDGNDTAYVKDGYADFVKCGDGNDRVTIDDFDITDGQCESVLPGDLRG
jgi:Ca2+-binding RTX toxin-like protein